VAGLRSVTPQFVGTDEETANKITECDRKPAKHRAALDAGGNPATAAA
jgi:hypothetical protein